LHVDLLPLNDVEFTRTSESIGCYLDLRALKERLQSLRRDIDVACCDRIERAARATRY
jgi:hypothetical protein